jgi:hypothetical protein
MSNISHQWCNACKTSTEHNFHYEGVTESHNEPCVVAKTTCIKCYRRKLIDKQPIVGLSKIVFVKIAEWYKTFVIK